MALKGSLLMCSYCEKSLEECQCVCPFCGERDGCECAIGNAVTGG